MKLKGLGRGLDALLADNDAQSREQQRTLPVGRLQPGKYQPRTRMDSASLEELAASIRVQGLMQQFSYGGQRRPLRRSLPAKALASGADGWFDRGLYFDPDHSG
jgi:hypothetical protein